MAESSRLAALGRSWYACWQGAQLLLLMQLQQVLMGRQVDNHAGQTPLWQTQAAPWGATHVLLPSLRLTCDQGQWPLLASPAWWCQGQQICAGPLPAACMRRLAPRLRRSQQQCARRAAGCQPGGMEQQHTCQPQPRAGQLGLCRLGWQIALQKQHRAALQPPMLCRLASLPHQLSAGPMLQHSCSARTCQTARGASGRACGGSGV